MLLTLIWCACAHSPEPNREAPGTASSSSSSREETSPSASEPGRVPEPTPHLRGPVAASVFAAVMGYDPRLSTEHAAVTRVSFFEAVELANALSARAGLPACYEVSCEGAAAPGCARMGQPYCEDLRKCTTRRRPGPCGYRLPTRGAGDGEVGIWLEKDGETCVVGGRTRLSSADTDPGRRAPTRCTLRADHVGVALELSESGPSSPGTGGAKPSRP